METARERANGWSRRCAREVAYQFDRVPDPIEKYPPNRCRLVLLLSPNPLGPPQLPQETFHSRHKRRRGLEKVADHFFLSAAVHAAPNRALGVHFGSTYRKMSRAPMRDFLGHQYCRFECGVFPPTAPRLLAFCRFVKEQWRGCCEPRGCVAKVSGLLRIL